MKLHAKRISNSLSLIQVYHCIASQQIILIDYNWSTEFEVKVIISIRALFTINSHSVRYLKLTCTDVKHLFPKDDILGRR